MTLLSAASTSVYTRCQCACGCEPCDYLTEMLTDHDECDCRVLGCPCIESCGC